MKSREGKKHYPTYSGNTACNLLSYLYYGGTDSEAIYELAMEELGEINRRIDCCDFRVGYLTRVLYSFEDRLAPKLVSDIEQTLFSFLFEDCGGHGMCTWTENHRLYIDGSEYLLGQKYPKVLFGDGASGERHMLRAKEKLEKWFEHVEKYGFCEWGSNNYYPETMAALSNLVQYASDEILRRRAAKCFNILCLDIFSRTSNNGGFMFNPACARAYVDNKLGAFVGNYLEKQLRAVKGEILDDYKEKETCVSMLLRTKTKDGSLLYSIPVKVLGLLDKDEKETAFIQGVNVSDYAKYGLKSYSHDNVRYAFESGVISDYRVIAASLRYLCETGMIHSDFLKGISPFGKPVLYRTGLIKLIKRFVPTIWDSSAMEEGKVYTYTKSTFSISAAFDYRVGRALFQQNPLSVNLSYRISLFVTAPYKCSQKKGSPDYWIGGAVAPRAVAYRNTAFAIFDTKRSKLKKTHLFFPTGLFDDIDLSMLDDGILLGRTMGVNVCVRTNPGVYFIPIEESEKEDISLLQDEKVQKGIYTSKYDLINEAAGFHYYCFEVDDTLSFDAFRECMGHSGAVFDKRTKWLKYQGRSNSFSLRYKGDFLVDGKVFMPDFIRPGDLVELF